MKIVINRCFGGYSLSPKAVKRLAELNNKECHFYMDGIGKKPYRKVSIEECSGLFWSAFSIGDEGKLNEIMKGEKDWGKMSSEEKDKYNKRYNEISLDGHPESRTDGKLIQVVEELGKEANGQCASLKIVEIPDGTDYEISEYDGLEHIAETHKTWS